jgi:hypothetical protein
MYHPEMHTAHTYTKLTKRFGENTNCGGESKVMTIQPKAFNENIGAMSLAPSQQQLTFYYFRFTNWPCIVERSNRRECFRVVTRCRPRDERRDRQGFVPRTSPSPTI